MKKIIPILFITILLAACEKANINLIDENIENRLKSMVGEKIGSVGNTLKAEGFQKFNFDEQVNYIKGTESYIFTTSNKTIISAGYQNNDSTKIYNLLDKYHYYFIDKNTENYSGEIYATNFNDFGKIFFILTGLG